ncbi:MAG: hypothetical protein P1U55_11300, partial [Vannielia sp.]|nr:hypothetical protein [Vannielia sp.]
EFREREDGGASPRLLQLSEALPGVEILGFRLSGARHPGAEFGFSVYRNGKAVRRLGTRSVQGLSDDADWQVTDSGVPHRSEARLRPGPAFADRLTPAMQAQLLEALGVDPDAFLEDRSAYTEVIELSTRPVAPEAPAPTPGTTPAAPTPEEKAETHPAPAADQKAEPEPKQPAGLPTGAAWEEEVTSLLIDAVNDALPTEAQVSWLDALTTQLNAGDIDAALASAAALITNGDRPEATKQAAISRLTALFSARG